MQGLIIGGVAVSLLARPRFTRDVDALVWLDEGKWEGFIGSGAGFGFIPRLKDALAFARKARMLLLNHAPTGMDVDITFGALPFEQEVIKRKMLFEEKSFSIPLATPEDLIIMKAVSHRPVDLIDIESLLDAQPRLNLRRIRRWLKDFARALDMPEILDDFEKLVLNRRQVKKSPVKKSACPSAGKISRGK